MGTWSITPSTASIDQNGNATFPPNSSNDEIQYTIKYKDGDMECIKTVIQEGTGCKFTYSQISSDIPSTGGDNVVFGTFSNYNEDALSVASIEVYEGSSYVTNLDISVSNHNVTGNVTANDSDEVRTIGYIIKSSNGSECSKNTIKQKHKEEPPCSCDDLTVSPTSLTFDWDGGTIPQTVNITSAECVTNIQATCTGGKFFIANSGENFVNVDVGENTGTTTLTGTLTISYNSGCTKTVSLSQTPQSIASCSDFTFNDLQVTDEMRMPTSVSIPLDVLNISGPSYADVAALTIECSGNVSLVERERTGDGQTIRCRFSEASTPSVDTIKISCHGQVCKTYTVFRICPCGTDDCESNLGGYIINNEIPADSWVVGNDGNTAFTYNGNTYPYRYINGDSLCCDHTKVKINGSYLEPSTYISDPDGNSYHLGGWSAITCGGNVMVGYREGMGTEETYGVITYTMLTNNYTTSRKDYSITFDVDPGTRLGKNSPLYNQLWPNATVCTQFTVNIRQAPSGGHYDRHPDGGNCGSNQYGVALRMLTPIPGPAWPGEESNRQIIIDNSHTCMLPPFSPDSYH